MTLTCAGCGGNAEPHPWFDRESGLGLCATCDTRFKPSSPKRRDDEYLDPEWHPEPQHRCGGGYVPPPQEDRAMLYLIYGLVLAPVLFSLLRAL